MDPLTALTIVSTTAWLLGIIARHTPTEVDDRLASQLGLIAEKARNLLLFSRPSRPSQDIIRDVRKLVD